MLTSYSGINVKKNTVSKWPGREPQRLTIWHKSTKRHFSWRNNPEPYHIFVAEFMLQRTQPIQVQPVYDKFISRWPDLISASEASKDDLLSVLKSLGRHSRASQLRKALAYCLSTWGKIPNTIEQLETIPGVGNYITRAVLCFGFGRSVGLIDPGITRVFGRFFGLVSDKKRPQTDSLLWQVADHLTPKKRADQYNLALLDLASMVCTPRNPRHDICPISKNCKYLKEHDEE